MFGKKNESQPDMEFFTVYDSKGKCYREPFPAPNKDVVLRDFVNAFKKPNASQENVYYLNAEDYSIFRCGTFDKNTGCMVGINLEHVANLHDLRAIAGPGIVPT